MIRAMNIIANEPDLLASVREVYSRLPKTYYREPWEMQRLLISLGYTDHLAEEAEIDAAIEVARTDFNPEAGAA